MRCYDDNFKRYYRKLDHSISIKLDKILLKILENPELGKEYEEIKSNLLGLRTGKHIIFYQVVYDQQIEIIRILHERMDLIKKLNE
jgi:toxin ParE1/3/4